MTYTLPWHQKCLTQFLVCLKGLFLSTLVLAVESYPPLVPDGETFKDVEALIQQTSRHNIVLSVAFSPDGSLLASGHWDGTIHIWDVNMGLELKRLQGHSSPVNTVAFSPDGHLLASGSSDNMVRLWNIGKGSEIHRLDGHSDNVNSVAFSPDGSTLVSGSDDSTIRLWDVSSGLELKRLEKHSDKVISQVMSVAFSSDGNTLASSDLNDIVRLWNVNMEQELKPLEVQSKGVVYSKGVRSIAFSPDGSILASGSDDGTVRLWDVNKDRELKRLEGHSDRVMNVAFSPDSHILASGSLDDTVRLWDVNTSIELARLEGHSNGVMSVAFSPDGHLLASGSMDPTVRLWDFTQKTEILQLTWYVDSIGYSNPVWNIAFSLDGQMLASSLKDGTVRLWDVHQNTERLRLQKHSDDVLSSVAFSPNGRLLASGSGSTVLVWNISDGTQHLRLQGHSRSVWSVAFSPDGHLLASGSSDSTVRLWNVSDGTERKKLQESKQIFSVMSIAFSPDGRFLASGSFDGSLRLWNVNDGTKYLQLPNHSSWISSVTFSPNGHLLASGYYNGLVVLWDISDGTEQLRWKKYSNKVLNVAFSPDGHLLASGSEDGTVLLWNVSDGTKHLQRQENFGEINNIAFISDGSILASSSYSDGTMRLWDVQTGKVQQIWVSSARGTWVSCDIPKQHCLRGDDGTLLVEVDKQNGNVTPILPPKEAGQLELLNYPKALTVVHGELTPFTLTVRNSGQGRVFWIKVTQTSQNDLVLHFPETIGFLEAGESKELHLKIGAWAKYDNPHGKEIPLDLQISSAHGDPILVSIPVHTHVATLTIVEVKLEKQDEPTLLVKVKNSGQQPLTESVFQLYLGETRLGDTLNQELIKAGEIVTLPFIVPENQAIDQQTSLSLVARKTTHPSHVWTPEMPSVILPITLWYNSYALLSSLLIVLAIVLYYLSFYRHPLVVKLSANANGLLTLPVPELAKAQQLLWRTRRLDSVLSGSAIPHKSLEEAIQFADMPPATRAKVLAKRLGAQAIPLEVSGLFTLWLPETFPLNLEHCLLYFPATDLPEAEITGFLGQETEAEAKLLIISLDSTQQTALRPYGENPATLWIVPETSEISELLLSAKPLLVLVRLFANQLQVTQISPYQTHSGVNKDTIFFGRTQMLAHILHRKPANYFLVGGRQLGKSSILKHLYRYYYKSYTVSCHYLTLSSDSIQTRFAMELGLPQESDLATVLDYLRKGNEQRRLVLIDEADLFIRIQAREGYPILKAFRSLSEEGKCHFIFAGFWELYAAMALDYQSPLKNFGEALTVGALEEQACRDLATKPMANLNIRYTEPALVEKMLTATGQRANLIAIICNEMLKKLPSTQRRLEAEDLDKALDSEAVRDALADWGNLGNNSSPDETQTPNLDRLCVYATVKAGEFDKAQVMTVLNDLGVRYTTAQLEQSIARLVLSFVIQRQKGYYIYHVPLLREMILEDDVDALLKQEALEFAIREK